MLTETAKTFVRRMFKRTLEHNLKIAAVLLGDLKAQRVSSSVFRIGSGRKEPNDRRVVKCSEDRFREKHW
jgi:hypothetical protein